MAQSQGSNCLVDLRLKIRKQIAAFRIMSSLNSDMSSGILIGNIEELLTKGEHEVNDKAENELPAINNNGNSNVEEKEKKSDKNEKQNGKGVDNPFSTAKLKSADDMLVQVTRDGRKLYECIVCKRTLTQQRNARLHVRRVHYNARMPCIKCGSLFYDYKHLGIHLKNCNGVYKDNTNGLAKKIKNKLFKQNNLRGKKKQSNSKMCNPVEKQEMLKVASSIIIKNPTFPKFNLMQALSVKVQLEPLHLPGLQSEVPKKFKKKKSKIRKIQTVPPPIVSVVNGHGNDDETMSSYVSSTLSDQGQPVNNNNNNHILETPSHNNLYFPDDDNYVETMYTQNNFYTPVPEIPIQIQPSQPQQQQMLFSEPPRSRLLVDDPSKNIVDMILHNLGHDEPTLTAVVNQRDFDGIENIYYRQQVTPHNYGNEFLPPEQQSYHNEFYPPPSTNNYYSIPTPLIPVGIITNQGEVRMDHGQPSSQQQQIMDNQQNFFQAQDTSVEKTDVVSGVRATMEEVENNIRVVTKNVDDSEVKIFECVICNNSLRTRKSVLAHIRRVHFKEHKMKLTN